MKNVLLYRGKMRQAPQVGLEPTTLRLTVGASAAFPLAGMTLTGISASAESPQLPERTPQLPTVSRESHHAELIAARLVPGGTDRWCDEYGRAISSASPLRLTYRQGLTVFVSWVHPHVSEDEGQLPCAPDCDLVSAALGGGINREKSTASTTDDGPATVRP